jgi:hypothetical protein
MWRLPDHDEIAGGIRADISTPLPIGRRGVDLKLVACREYTGEVALALDATSIRIGSIGASALPYNDETAIGLMCRPRPELILGSVGVDAELPTERVWLLGEDRTAHQQ